MLTAQLPPPPAQPPAIRAASATATAASATAASETTGEAFSTIGATTSEGLEGFGGSGGVGGPQSASRVSRIPESSPAFLRNLFVLLEDPVAYGTIRWLDAGNGFTMPAGQESDFTSRFLPRVCNSTSLCAFIRQLNGYGFKKIDPKTTTFTHSTFHRDHPELLNKIERRKSAKRVSSRRGSEGVDSTMGAGGRVIVDTELDPPAQSPHPPQNSKGPSRTRLRPVLATRQLSPSTTSPVAGVGDSSPVPASQQQPSVTHGASPTAAPTSLSLPIPGAVVSAAAPSLPLAGATSTQRHSSVAEFPVAPAFQSARSPVSPRHVKLLAPGQRVPQTSQGPLHGKLQALAQAGPALHSSLESKAEFRPQPHTSHQTHPHVQTQAQLPSEGHSQARSHPHPYLQSHPHSHPHAYPHPQSQHSPSALQSPLHPSKTMQDHPASYLPSQQGVLPKQYRSRHSGSYEKDSKGSGSPRKGSSSRDGDTSRKPRKSTVAPAETTLCLLMDAVSTLKTVLIAASSASKLCGVPAGPGGSPGARASSSGDSSQLSAPHVPLQPGMSTAVGVQLDSIRMSIAGFADRANAVHGHRLPEDGLWTHDIHAVDSALTRLLSGLPALLRQEPTHAAHARTHQRRTTFASASSPSETVPDSSSSPSSSSHEPLVPASTFSTGLRPPVVGTAPLPAGHDTHAGQGPENQPYPAASFSLGVPSVSPAHVTSPPAVSQFPSSRLDTVSAPVSAGVLASATARAAGVLAPSESLATVGQATSSMDASVLLSAGALGTGVPSQFHYPSSHYGQAGGTSAPVFQVAPASTPSQPVPSLTRGVPGPHARGRNPIPGLISSGTGTTQAAHVLPRTTAIGSASGDGGDPFPSHPASYGFDTARLQLPASRVPGSGAATGSFPHHRSQLEVRDGAYPVPGSHGEESHPRHRNTHPVPRDTASLSMDHDDAFSLDAFFHQLASGPVAE